MMGGALQGRPCSQALPGSINSLGPQVSCERLSLLPPAFHRAVRSDTDRLNSPSRVTYLAGDSVETPAQTAWGRGPLPCSVGVLYPSTSRVQSCCYRNSKGRKYGEKYKRNKNTEDDSIFPHCLLQIGWVPFSYSSPLTLALSSPHPENILLVPKEPKLSLTELCYSPGPTRLGQASRG